ncbi:hypothetical protein CSO01_38150 [Cellulomonas soli]|uniref:Uncharacterized protein n=1 Tax=Cellulomonas soli TaxID=931535 RepID=A0A512PIS6_9CELL|nr:hypothetical protein CSO01_38150 [Cellulomonas soli]
MQRMPGWFVVSGNSGHVETAPGGVSDDALDGAVGSVGVALATAGEIREAMRARVATTAVPRSQRNTAELVIMSVSPCAVA